MKAFTRHIILLLVLCLMFCLASCGKADIPDESVSDTSAQNITEAETTAKDEAPEETTVQNESATAESTELLSLDKEFISHYDWQEGYPDMLVRSIYSNISVDENCAELYPVIAKALKETAAMRSNAMESERENFAAIAKEAYETDPDSFGTQVSEMDTVVRRADSVAVSIIEDYSSDGIRYIAGYNFDSESGNILTPSDVIADLSKVPSIAESIIMSRIGEADTKGETAVSEYFKNTSEESLSWTLEYNGVTFWFRPGSIAPTNFGVQSVTITFKDYPELFNKKYTASPDEYIAGIPSALSFTYNNSGKAEELVITGNYDKTGAFYKGFSIQTSSSDYEAECKAYNIHPYYVKTADGNSYLYVFADGSKEEDRQMKLLIFDLKNSKIEKLDELNMGLLYRGDNIFALPTNPEKLLLYDYDGRYASLKFKVGENGLPEMSDSQEYN